MIVNPTTFQPTAEAKTFSWGSIQDGTVEATLGRDTRRVRAFRTVGPDETSVTALDMTGRYRTGGKAWAASVKHYVGGNRSGHEWVNFGRDDRNPKFNKANALFFAPEKAA